MDALTVGILVSRDLQRATLDTSGCDLASGVAVAEALCALGHRPRMIYVDENLDLALRAGPLDAAFICLHGNRGGDGRVQAALAMRDIPFSGPDAATTALAFDKSRARTTLAFHNLPVPTSVDLCCETPPTEAALSVLGWPCVIKPRRGAHGVGVTRVERAGEVAHAIDLAMSIDTDLIIERALAGRELQVMVVGGEVLGMADVSRDDGSFVVPTSLSRGRADGIARLAQRAAHVMGLAPHTARVDVLVDPDGNEWLLEVEPLPPLHRESALQRLLVAEGIRFTDYIAACVDRLREGRVPHLNAGAHGVALH